MKNILSILLLALFLQSCNTFYQVYEVETNLEKNENVIVYSDDNCDVVYDLWGCGGNASFIFVNKTDEDIIINLKKSYFIKNGQAIDYYDNSSYTSTRSWEQSSSLSVLSSYETFRSNSLLNGQANYTFKPYNYFPTIESKYVGNGIFYGSSNNTSKKLSTTNILAGSSSKTKYPTETITIPANSFKRIDGFVISNYVHYECDKRFDYAHKNCNKIVYTKSDSPLIFENRITYVINDKEYNIENEFWVSSLKNYKESEMFIDKKEKPCHGVTYVTNQYFKFKRANMFYNIYNLEQ